MSGVVQTGGVFSGPGVTDDGNGMTYSFDPAAAGVGVQTLVYTISGMSFSDEVEVLAAPVIVFPPIDDPLVFGAVVNGLGGASPVGGVYSGTHVTDDGNGMTFSFDAGASGLGLFPVTYTFTNANGCTESMTINLTVSSISTPSFSKGFSPATVALGGVSTLTFTITNNVNAPLEAIAFVDNLPAGMVVADPP
ncbi:MAG: hypothetical protein AAGD05_10340, partial [Bacteroidota bacterium]